MIVCYEITLMVAASILLVVFGSMMIVITNEPLELGMSNLRQIENHHIYRLCMYCCKTFMNMATDGDMNVLRDAPTSLTFNNCTLCPVCIYVFCIYLKTNSDLCHLQHKLIGFVTEMKSVYCAVRPGSLN